MLRADRNREGLFVSRLLVLIVIVAVLAGGCDGHQSAGILRDLLGLQVGRHFTYVGEGNEYASFELEVTHNRGSLYQLAEATGGTVLARVVELRRDGAYEILTRGEHYSRESLLTSEAIARRDPKLDRKLLPWPLREGSSWSMSDDVTATLVTTTAQRTVPAGTFRNVVQVRTHTYSSSDPDASAATLDFYYAPGVGPIERHFNYEDVVITSRLSEMTRSN